MKKILFILVFLTLSSNSYSESLGKNKTINDYLDNGYQVQSISILDKDKLLYNLIMEKSKEKIFEPKIIGCIYNLNTQISDCFKP